MVAVGRPRLGKRSRTRGGGIIIGCDFHTRYQQIAMANDETGELPLELCSQWNLLHTESVPVYHVKGWGKFNRNYGDFCTGADNYFTARF